MGEVITNLKAKFSVDSQNVGKGLKPGQDALADLDRMVGKGIANLKGMLTPLALLGAAGGALATFKGALDSIEGPGDRLAAVMGGVKESLFEAGKALATLDFSSFIENLDLGYERGKRLTELLDELEERSAYNDYRINQLSRESAGLQEIVKNKTLEISVRTDAANKIEAIEEKIRDRRIEIAQEEFDIQRTVWEGRNRMDADQALALYESIDAMGPEVKARLQKVFSTTTLSLGLDKGIREILSGGMQASLAYGVGGNVFTDQFLAISDKDVQSYAQYFQLLEKGERDVLQKLFNTYKQIEEVGYKAQEDYNATVAMTSGLLQQQQREVDALRLKKSLAAAEELADLKKANELTRDTKLAPSLGEAYKLPVSELVAMKTEIIEISNEIGDIVNDGLGKAMEGFSMWIGEFAVGAANSKTLVQVIGSTFGDMLIQLGKVALATGVGIAAIKKAFESMNPIAAFVAGGALIAFGSAIKASVGSIGDSMGSGGGGGYSAGSSGFNYDARATMYDRPIEVIVAGEFVLRNNVLTAAVEQERRRTRAST
jgi:hypothetical protein